MKKNYIEECHHDAELGERISKAIKGFSNEQETISIEELESWVEMDNMKRRAKRKRVMSVAACFLLICGFSLSMRYYVNMDDPIAVAGGGDMKVSTEENVGGNEYIRTDWDEAMKLAEEYPDMLIPGYVPEGYEFKELRVTKTSVGNSYEFVFADVDLKLFSVRQKKSVEAAVITGYDLQIHGNKGTIYLKYDGDLISAMSLRDKTTVKVQGEDSKEQLVQVIDKLKSGS